MNLCVSAFALLSAHIVSCVAQDAQAVVTSPSQSGTEQTCLPDAVPSALRRDLLGDSASYPLGLWSLYGSQMELDTPSTIFKILAEEVLGYNVRASAQDVSTAEEALWMLAGCAPNDPEGCHGSREYHVTFGVTFSWNVSVEFGRVQRLQMGGLLENLASMGYLARSGIYLTESLVHYAESSRSRALLDDYRSYDALYHRPQQYFDDLQYFDSQTLLDCADWLDPDQAALCENRWWKAPMCRVKSNLTVGCVPCLTATLGGTAYRVSEVMQKAVAHRMPLALGVTQSVKDLHDLVVAHRTLFVFWEPDVTFLLLHPRRISFPKHNPVQWKAGDYSTDSEAQDPRIVVSSDLMRLAPDARELLLKMKWSLQDIDSMMQQGVEQKVSADSNGTIDRGDMGDMLEAQLSSGHWIADAAWKGACEWLLTKEYIWRTWIPQADSCLHGQGLFSTSDGWLEVRQVGAVCRPCEPGSRSQMITDDTQVDTAVCRPCDPGYKQPSFSALSCGECPRGRISDSFGSTECSKCPIGFFQNRTGQSTCLACPKNMVTSIEGATTELECICSEDTYWQMESSTCVQCPQEFICNGSFAPPMQRAGHWAEDLGGGDYSIYYCRDLLRCPEGYPGQCQVGRTGVACADCYKGFAAAADGSCQPCDALKMWPFILLPVVIVGVVPILVFASVMLSRARRVAITVFVVCLVFGQLVVCLQSLEAIYQFDILWVDPAKAVLSSLAIFSLDIEFSCVLPPRSFLMEYAFQLMAYPIVLVSTFLLWYMARFTRKRVSFSAFVNFHGIVLVALLTAMSLSVLRPFQCRENPNGLSTMVTQTDVVCWTTGKHGGLVALAVVGVLAYPVSILSAISFLTWKYPIWLRSSSGLEVLERYKFLFGRFRPERYYYGLLLSWHNLVVALIPAALVSVPALQVGIMGIVVCVKLTTQSLLWPWRVDVANYNDMVLSAGLLILLLLASPLLNLNEQKAMEFVAVLLACVMFILPIAALLAASAAVCFRLRPQSKYSMFLCHHKAGAGALCRFIKLIVHKYGRMNIFLDSDELDDLARIFEIVSSDTRCLVAVLTPELLQRMWCAGEMTSARKHGIPIIPLYCDGYAFPDADSINNIQSVWTEEQQYTLTSHGISMEDIKAAYIHIRTLTFVTLRRSDRLEEQERAVLRLMSAVSPGSAGVEVPPQGSIANARILVCSSDAEPEFVSTRLLLQQMIQRHLQVAVFSAQSPADLPVATKATFVVVLLSRGVLKDATFARLAVAIRSERIEFVPVNDGSFQFPSPEFYRKVEGGDIAIAGLSEDSGPTLAKAYQAILSILALPFAPHGSSGILDRQVMQICQRFGNLEDSPQRRFSPPLPETNATSEAKDEAFTPSPASAETDDMSSSDDALCV